MNAIAHLDLIEVSADGKRHRVRVEIGQPQIEDRGSWECPVLLTSIDEKVRHIPGVDSMQALCLAIQFLHTMLKSRLELGSRLLEADDVSDFPLQAYFGNKGQQVDGPNSPPASQATPT